MRITREHLKGMELALDRWNDGGPAVHYAALLHGLIAQAQAAPVAEPVAWLRTLTGADCKPDGRCYEIVFTPCDGYTPLFAAPPHDAELVELIEELIDVDDGGLDDYWREHAGKELMSRIDAKLASLRGVKP